ncbi:MAG: hypothetical protein R6X02_13345 [Enhygromyxa sp.]
MPTPGLAREPVEPRERRLWLLALALAAVVAVVLRLTTLEVGRLSDDYMQHAMIAGLFPGEGYVPFDLYSFVRADMPLAEHVDQGTVPWFAEPGFHGSVLRPLSSLFLWLDHTLAPGNIRLWHAHSLLWLALTIVGFGLAARRMLPRWPAALALALFVCEAGFVSPLGWLANRCVLICAAFGFAAIFVHLEWRRPDPSTPSWLRRGGPLIELGLLAASLAGGEYGLGVIAYLFAWELLVGGRDATSLADPWLTRALALIPAATVTATYLALHSLLDYGTFGADVYADPLSHPSGWLKWAKFRIPALCTGAFWSIPASSVMVFDHPGASWWQARWPVDTPHEVYFSHLRISLVGIGLAAVALGLARAGWRDDERRTLRALLLGALLGLLPVSVAPSHARLLIITQLGACAAVSLVVFGCLRLLFTTDRRRLLGVALLPLVGAALALNTYFDLRWTQRYLRHLDGLAEADVMAFTDGDLLEQELAGRDVLVLNGPSQSVGMYGPFALHVMGEPVPASWRPLSLGGEHAMFAYRPDENTLELAAIQGAWLMTAGELFFRRAEQRLPTGSTLDYPGFHVEVLADDGEGRPTRVGFRFPHSLDDPRYLFVTSTGRGLNRWSVPPVHGKAVIPLPRVPFPSHLFSLMQKRAGPK